MTELQGHEDRLEISADSGVFVRSRAEGSHGRSRVGGSAVQHPHSARSGVLPIAPMGSPPSAAQTTPWPRPGRGRVLWPEARSSESAVPRSHPCTTGTAAPEPKRSDDPPHAPWFVPPTHGASAYPRSRSRRIPCRLHQPEFVSQGPNAGKQEWRPIWTAPVNTPVLVRVAGQSEPVVAICDEDRCWQVAWTGDLLPRPILWHPIPGSNG